MTLYGMVNTLESTVNRTSNFEPPNIEVPWLLEMASVPGNSDFFDLKGMAMMKYPRDGQLIFPHISMFRYVIYDD